MSCDVCLDVDSGATTEFFYEETRKARKQHKCSECSGVIDVGKKYWRVGGKCEGEIWRQSICGPCHEVNRVFSCGGYREFGNLWGNMEESVFPELTTSTDCFNKLGIEARAKLTEMWWHWKE